MSATAHAGPLSTPGLTLGDLLVPAILAERAPAWVRDAVLILAGTVLLIVGAYASFTVPSIQLGQLWVPVNQYVPLTLQTFGVLFTGALLGARRGVVATGLYLLIGIVGLPVFAAAADGVHRSGLDTIVGVQSGRVVLGATGGYLLGFLCASFVVGRLAEHGWDRHIGGSIVVMAIGSCIVYVFGVAWLALAADLGVAEALGFGLWPFLPGDVAKMLVAAGLLPLGWRLAGGRASGRRGGRAGPA